MANARPASILFGLDLYHLCWTVFPCCCSRRRRIASTDPIRSDETPTADDQPRIEAVKHTAFMATETGDPAQAGGKAPESEQTPQPAPAPSNQQPPAAKEAKPPVKDAKQAAAKGGDAAAAAAAGGEKKLSNAELKKKQKEEKAARRAQAKASQPSQPAPGQPGQAATQGDGKGGQKQRQGSAAGLGQQQKGGSQARQAAPGATPAVAPKEVKPSIPECFSHLSLARRIPITQADKDVNPAVLVLGQHMSSFAISDSITRLETTLYAFKKVGTVLD